MASDTKALLLNVSVSSATNNIRKYLTAVALNFPSASQAFQTLDVPVAANNGTFTWTPVPGNSVSVILTSCPLVASVTTPQAITYQVTLSSIWILDYSIQTIVFTNTTIDQAKLSIISA